MLHLFCTADFVARGMVEAVRTQPGRAHSQVHVVANAVLRQAAPVFADVTPLAKGGEPHRWRATLVLPARCGAAHGPGEFLFLGRLQLGQPALACAPQLHHWAMVRAAALQEGRGKCSLDT
ncbi:hypothetical protein R5R35_000499 [Gryllus longicercus]|uniref:Uncharacterized protein n=1 Tax=Gryllus longicercus TaxID=2509291 RepID=A0AAN9V3P8_9ORTH